MEKKKSFFNFIIYISQSAYTTELTVLENVFIMSENIVHLAKSILVLQNAKNEPIKNRNVFTTFHTM